jgi:hypothetical protein
MPSEHRYVIRNLWNSIVDAQNAVPILKAQIDANKSAVASVTNTVTNNSTASETIIQQIVSAYGTVNNQSGNVAYSTTQSDASAFIILSDASPVAVSLTAAPVITLPWACVLVNEGVGLVTATPASGTISYPNNIAAASIPVAQGQAAIICFDGTNFFSVIIAVQPQNTPSIVHQWITAYNSITGVFSQSQPAVGDVTGAAPIASPTFTGTVTEPTPPVLTAAVTATSATAGAASALPSAPLGYLDWSVNGVTVKVPFYSV